MKSIIELTNSEAKAFLLKGESYCSIDLPQYFNFNSLISKISEKIGDRKISDFYSSYKPNNPKEFDGVNHILLNNKDGKFAWRPFQLIHPALYASLIHRLTETENWQLIQTRFNKFYNNDNIKCFSLPICSEGKQSDKATLVTQWWQEIEQNSIKLGLKYQYMLQTDITDCYGSIYSHSISWALHTKETAKSCRDSSLIGNVIDYHLQAMSYGQTNGIPQGSVLMDFIAEMVLGYIDLELTKKIESTPIIEYEILRYRDDYRIFSNNPQDAELIAKLLTEVLIEIGLRLNTQKTFVSDNIISDSLKSDKLFWISNQRKSNKLIEQLYIVHSISLKHPNSGTLSKLLLQFFNRIKKIKSTKENLTVLISIIVDIAYKNPRTYPVTSAILSKLISMLDSSVKKIEIVKDIRNRFNKIPNTGLLQIWLQRITICLDNTIDYQESLCKKVLDDSIIIWNSDWLADNIQDIISSKSFIIKEEIEKLTPVVESKEIELFVKAY
jgi:RNA-directed DNA polymerase